jgi:tetratricopeptide (TPR) repeat protein
MLRLIEEGAALIDNAQSQEDYKRAREKLQQAYRISSEQGRRTVPPVLCDLLGQVYRNLGEDDTAREYFEKAVEIAREFRDRKYEGRALFGLAGLSSQVRQYEKAVGYYTKSLAIAQDLGDRQFQAVILNHLGTCFKTMERYDRAEECLDKSLRSGDTLLNCMAGGQIK